MKEAERVADEIIEKYEPYVEGNDYDLGVESRENAKQCALVHVEGIIKLIAELEVSDFMKYDLIEQWAEVKTIIENK